MHLQPAPVHSPAPTVQVVTVGDVSVLLTDAEPYSSAEPHNSLPAKLLNGHGDEEPGSSSREPGSSSSGSNSGGSSAASSSADQSPNKIILTEHKLEERKR